MGAVAIYLARSGVVGPLDDDVLQTLRMAFIVILGVVAIAMYLFRRRRRLLSKDEDPTAINIIGWALGESVAFFGAVLLIVSGDITYFLVGFVMMLVSFVFFPIPPEG